MAKVTSDPSFPKFGPAEKTGGNPKYPEGTDPLGPEICSFTQGCIAHTDVAWAPNGTIGVNFDDGPSEFSPQLYDFLEERNLSVTHFYIGGNILYNVDTFDRAVRDGGHIALHTWSHPYMTTLTNEQVVAELGWTSQIVADLSGGRVPAYWRPPYGDVDNRVRTIAMEVFGLKTVPWSSGHDTQDWQIGSSDEFTVDSVVNTVRGWLQDPEKKGFIALEHESSQAEVDVFKQIYPIMMENNWKLVNVAETDRKSPGAI